MYRSLETEDIIVERYAMIVTESDVLDSVLGETDTDSTESPIDGGDSPGEIYANPGTTPSGEKPARRIRLSISLRVLGIATVIATLISAVSVLAWLYMGAESKLSAEARQSENRAHAEKVALDYAVNAAQMDFGDLNAWKTKLVAGTSGELNGKLTKAAGEMEQILVPLQWSSSARPLVAKVRSDTGNIYVVDCFVSVLTKTIQAPEPLQSTATYSITIDSEKNWQIIDVGGIGAALDQK